MKKKKTSERFSKRVLSALRKTTNKICSNMEHRVFFDKVSLMRMRQKEYFKTRSKNTYINATNNEQQEEKKSPDTQAGGSVRDNGSQM